MRENSEQPTCKSSPADTFYFLGTSDLNKTPESLCVVEHVCLSAFTSSLKILSGKRVHFLVAGTTNTSPEVPTSWQVLWWKTVIRGGVQTPGPVCESTEIGLRNGARSPPAHVRQACFREGEHSERGVQTWRGAVCFKKR